MTTLINLDGKKKLLSNPCGIGIVCLHYKINSLVKDGDLPNDAIDEYLEGKESWKLTPKKKD